MKGVLAACIFALICLCVHGQPAQICQDVHVRLITGIVPGTNSLSGDAVEVRLCSVPENAVFFDSIAEQLAVRPSTLQVYSLLNNPVTQDPGGPNGVYRRYQPQPVFMRLLKPPQIPTHCADRYFIGRCEWPEYLYVVTEQASLQDYARAILTYMDKGPRGDELCVDQTSSHHASQAPASHVHLRMTNSVLQDKPTPP